MFKKKNNVALLLLLITGALAYNYFMRHHGNDLAMNAPSDNLRDSVANNSVHANGPDLKLDPTETGDLKDSVAQNPAQIGSGVGGHQGGNGGNNTGPRGGTDWNGADGSHNDFGHNGSHGNGGSTDISPSGPSEQLPQ